MLLAYQGLPRIYDPQGDNPTSRWKVYYAVVTSIPRSSLDFTQSCQTVYQNFRLLDCNGVPFDRLGPDDVGCDNCLKPDQYREIPFCDINTGLCLVGIMNMGDINQRYKENCYIEVFFVGKFQKQLVPPTGVPGEDTYDSTTVLTSLRWSATADFMALNDGIMLNCTNHTF